MPGDTDSYEYLNGDEPDESDEEGGDDIIYTGDSHAGNNGDYVFGGAGNDKLYGQGEADHFLEGNLGDDLIFGGPGDNEIWGDDYDGDVSWDATTGLIFDDSTSFGDDTIHGGEGDDEIQGGAGHDYLYGDEGDDVIVGSWGEDTIWGGEGSDLLYTGSGWDTVFGGPGCDYIYSQDGGDVIWAGDCDPEDDDESNDYQWIFVHGTGPDISNFTVIMDFWHETAMPWNMLCLYPDGRQGIPSSGTCNGVNDNFSMPATFNPSADLSCLTAIDIMSARAPVGSGD